VPKCGNSDELVVYECHVINGDMPLSSDGFEIGGDTEDEKVQCKACATWGR
jgi:hypothetical protein